MRIRPELGERARDALGLQAGELHRQRFALRRDVEQALAAVVRALLLQHVALVDELLEHAAERLLGDLQDVEQVGDLHAGIAVDEMQHPVVRAAEAELGQHVVRIADEVAIGEEQQLDDVPDRLARRRRRLGAGSRAIGRQRLEIFMSVMLTYFGLIVTQELIADERIVPAGSFRTVALHRSRQARSHRSAATYRVLARDAKAARRCAIRQDRGSSPDREFEEECHGGALRPASTA